MPMDPNLKAVYEHLGITEDQASHWASRSAGKRKKPEDMNEGHLGNAVCLAANRSGGDWPHPLRTYPSLPALMAEMHRRGLPKPNALRGLDWPWGSIEDIGLETAAAASRVFPDFDQFQLGTPAFTPKPNRMSNPAHAIDPQPDPLPAEERSMHDETNGAEDSSKSKAFSKFKEMASNSVDSAKHGASYQLMMNLLDKFIFDKYGMILPDWMKKRTTKAVFIWFFGAFAASGLEHEFFEDIPTKWISALAESAAYGAAAFLGADAFDVVWGLSGMLLNEVNSLLKPQGWQLNQDGSFEPAQITDADEISALSGLRKEIEKERVAMSEERAELRELIKSLRGDPKLSELASAG